MTSRTEELLRQGRTRPLTSDERAELDPRQGSLADPLALAEALAGGAQRLAPEEAERLFRNLRRDADPSQDRTEAAPLPEPAPAETLQVVVLREGALAGSLSLGPGEYAVGSDEDCEVRLDDPTIGRCHAFLVFRDGKTTLQTVSDEGGMRVNGVPQRTAEVRALDDVGFGPFVLKLRVMSPRPQRPPAPERPKAPAPRPASPPRPPPPPTPRAAAPAIAPPKPPPARPEPPAPRPLPAPIPTAAEDAGPAEGRDAGPVLRVRVFWGKTAVGVYGFAPGRAVWAGPSETADVAAYRLALPADRFLLARSDRAGRWTLRVPPGLRAFAFGREGWRPAMGAVEGDTTCIPLEPDRPVRLGDAAYSLELRVERVRRARRAGLAELVRSGVALPAGLVAALGAAAALVVAIMPHYETDAADFTPQQMLRAAKAVLKPPEKKEAEAKEERPREKERPSDKNVEVPPDVPRTREVKAVNQALKAMQKVTSGLAVESLLKATSKLSGGPKGYGDKGMGYKLSPLFGKPPVAMAGTSLGQGLGGFGTETRGLGALRGMGGGGAGGLGSFDSGGTGKGKVGGRVVASASGFRQRGGGGTLARELIAKVINDHLGEVRGCYERALLREAGLAGKLNLEWTIGTDGRVEEVRVKQATLKGAEVPNCIVGSLKTWLFPKPSGGKVVVSYPFLFNSVGF